MLIHKVKNPESTIALNSVSMNFWMSYWKSLGISLARSMSIVLILVVWLCYNVWYITRLLYDANG